MPYISRLFASLIMAKSVFLGHLTGSAAYSLIACHIASNHARQMFNIDSPSPLLSCLLGTPRTIHIFQKTSHGRRQDSNSGNPPSVSRYGLQDHTGTVFEPCRRPPQSTNCRVKYTQPRAEASVRGARRHFHGAKPSHGAHRHSSYTPHHDPRRELPKPLTASSSHLRHCGKWYRSSFIKFITMGFVQ